MSGALAFDAAWLFAGFLLLVVLLAAGLTLRRYLLERGGGTVECGLRLPGGSWRLGVAAYRPDALCWYQVFGLLLRPNQVFPRRTLSVLSRRAADSAEEASLGEGAVVVRCRFGEADPAEGGRHGGTRHGRGGAHRLPGLAGSGPARPRLLPRPGQLAGPGVGVRDRAAAPTSLVTAPLGCGSW